MTSSITNTEVNKARIEDRIQSLNPEYQYIDSKNKAYLEKKK